MPASSSDSSARAPSPSVGTEAGALTPTSVPTVLLHGAAASPGTQTPPTGGVTLTVLVTVDPGAAVTVALTVYVTAPPAGRLAMVWVMLPEPLALGQTAPPLTAQVQVAPVSTQRAVRPLLLLVTKNRLTPGLAEMDVFTVATPRLPTTMQLVVQTEILPLVVL